MHPRIDQHEHRDHDALRIFVEEVQAEIDQRQEHEVRYKSIGVAQETHACVSPELVRRAKRQTGIETDTDLIEFALATVALEDNFADVFKESRGKIDPKLKLGF